MGRPPGTGRGPLSVRARSAFILAVLGLQAVPVAREFNGARETLWPFLAWGMYRHFGEPPVEAVVHRVVAVTADDVRPVGPEDAGFERFAFRRYFQVPIAEGDSAAAAELAGLLGRRWRTPVREIVGVEGAYTLVGDSLHEAVTERRLTTGP
ncbi:MAG TPA: hypothetical protein VIE68_05025 [Gemmatimonadota bacterium]